MNFKKLKNLTILNLLIIGGLSFFCNEAVSHHTVEGGDSKEKRSTPKEEK